MDITYLEPLKRAIARMKKALFKPFNLNKWFIVGFTAFLAGLADGNPGSGGKISADDSGLDFSEVFDAPARAWEWLTDHPHWIAIIAIIMIVIISVVVLLLWLSSRGKFMFLDNVVHDRARISQPWKEYKRLGDSLFLWRLIFTLVCIIAVGVTLAFFFTTGARIYHEEPFFGIPVLIIIGTVLIGLVFSIILGYISLFLNNFVIPIMYKKDLTAIQAWGLFLNLFKQHIFPFILYGLIILVLTIAVVIGIVLAVIFTCCIGGILLIIPYISSVITLPISYTYRAFSLEFLSQFGEEYNLFPPIDETAVTQTTETS
jgi:hypothetical protein